MSDQWAAEREIRQVERERDRLREALEQIRDYSGGDWRLLAELPGMAAKALDPKRRCDERGSVVSEPDKTYCSFRKQRREEGR